MTDHSTPESSCPDCGVAFNAAAATDGERPPKVGDIGLCYKCAAVLVYDADLRMTAPTQAYLESLTEDEVARNSQGAERGAPVSSMTDHGILYSGAMVRATLAKRKKQTRRIITPHNSLFSGEGTGGPLHRPWAETLDWKNAVSDDGPSPAGNPGPYLHVPCLACGDRVSHRIYPRVQPGDQLVVREAWGSGSACYTESARGANVSTARSGSSAGDDEGRPMCLRPSTIRGAWSGSRTNARAIRLESGADLRHKRGNCRHCPHRLGLRSVSGRHVSRCPSLTATTTLDWFQPLIWRCASFGLRGTA